MTPKAIVVLGKSGSGKDTQAELLVEDLSPSMAVSTGDAARELTESPTLLGRRVRETIEKGGLLPAWLASFMWQRELAAKLRGGEHLIFSSSPRRVEEAKELDEVLSWLGRGRAEAVLLDIPDEEAVRRIVGRGRDEHDNKENVLSRLAWFREQVGPVIEYYREEGRLYAVNGVGDVHDIHKNILSELGIHDQH